MLRVLLFIFEIYANPSLFVCFGGFLYQPPPDQLTIWFAWAHHLIFVFVIVIVIVFVFYVCICLCALVVSLINHRLTSSQYGLPSICMACLSPVSDIQTSTIQRSLIVRRPPDFWSHSDQARIKRKKTSHSGLFWDCFFCLKHFSWDFRKLATRILNFNDLLYKKVAFWDKMETK